jgi:hypothetical protein
MRQFEITGKDRSGRRFKVSTTTPQHYNIWSGSLWEIIDGKRKLIRRY